MKRPRYLGPQRLDAAEAVTTEALLNTSLAPIRGITGGGVKLSGDKLHQRKENPEAKALPRACSRTWSRF